MHDAGLVAVLTPEGTPRLPEARIRLLVVDDHPVVCEGVSLLVHSSTDIVVTGTTATQPLFAGGDIRPGAHVNGVGSHAPAARELPADLVARSRVVVDTYEAAFAEAGDLLRAIEDGHIDREHVAAELGEVVLDRKPGRRSADEVTLFKSCGVAFEDAVTASLAVQRARAAGAGREFDFSG